MNKDLEEYLSQMKKDYQERIVRAEKYERRLWRRLRGQPDREDIINNIHAAVRARDISEELVNFITELQELYY